MVITLDFWSDRINRACLVVTGHFYDRDYQLKSTILACCSFGYQHTSHKIATILKKKLQDFNILHKVNRIVKDGAPNLSKPISLMDINAEHIWCTAHRLHLAVTHALALWSKREKNFAQRNKGEKINSYLHKYGHSFANAS